MKPAGWPYCLCIGNCAAPHRLPVGAARTRAQITMGTGARYYRQTRLFHQAAM